MWADSDVYKTIEGIIYTLAGDYPNDEITRKRMETIVASIVGAQRKDGYLFPHMQITNPNYSIF